MKKGPLFIHGSICLGIFLIGFGPIIVAVTASALASIAGCTLDEGSAHPCLIFAVDIGETLYSMAMLGWITRATLPVAAALFVIYGIVALVLRLMNRTG